MTAADVTQLRLDVDELARPGGLLARLEALLPEQVGDPSRGTSSSHKVTGSPAPWHAEAAGVLMDIHAGARELEDNLRAVLGFTRAHAGRTEIHPRRGPSGEHGPFRPVRVPAGAAGHRGDSAANTTRALRAIPDLAAAAGDPQATAATRLVERWCRGARQVGDIDEAERWEPLPRVAGRPPARCPYCSTFGLRMRPRSGEVRCTNPACTDPDGNRPRARVVVGPISHEGVLEFRDGARVTFAEESA
jgi:hypothetical protein